MQQFCCRRAIGLSKSNFHFCDIIQMVASQYLPGCFLACGQNLTANLATIFSKKGINITTLTKNCTKNSIEGEAVIILQ